MELDGKKQNWMVWDLTGQAQTPLDGLDRNDFTRLHYPGLNWKVPYRTVSSLHLARLICTELHCTFPNETDKDCTALHVNVLHWTRQHRIALHSNGSTLKGFFWIAETAMYYINLHLTYMQIDY